MKVLLVIALIAFVSAETLHPRFGGIYTGKNLTEGIYTFTDPVSGLNLAIEGDSVAEKAHLVLAKPSQSNGQKFLVKSIFGGYYTVANIKSGLYLAYEDDKIVQIPMTYTSELQWGFKERTAGEYYVEANLLINQTIKAEVGHPLTFTFHSKVKNAFKPTPTTVNAADVHKLDKATIEALTHKPATKLAAGTYTIAVVSTGHDLDLAKTGKQIIAAPAANTPSQHFKVEVNADGLYRIVNVKLGEAVITTGNEMDGGSEIDHVAIVEKDLKQWWRIVERGTGVYSIINEHSKESLTIPAGEHAVQQYFIGTLQQLFTFKVAK